MDPVSRKIIPSSRRSNGRIAFALLVVSVSSFAWLTYRAVHQEKLDFALVGAVRRGDAAAAQSLLERGADANVRVRPAQKAPTLLTYARGLILRVRGVRVQKENYPSVLLQASEDEDWDIVKCLAEHGADAKARDGDGMTALMYATYCGDAGSARLLLDRGVEVNGRLLAHATKVADTSLWIDPCYVWRDENHLLAFQGNIWRVEGDSPSFQQYKALPSWSKRSYLNLKSVNEMDLHTGRSHPLTAFNRKWKEVFSSYFPPEKRAPIIFCAHVSPDGKYIAWKSHGHFEGPGSPLSIASLDGSYLLQQTGIDALETIYDLAWLQNSKSWVGVTDGGIPFVNGQLSPFRITHGVEFNLASKTHRSFDLSAVVQLPADGTGELKVLGIQPDGRVLLAVSQKNSAITSRMELVDWGVSPNASPAHRRQISLPKDAWVRGIELSPAGDRLLWNLAFLATTVAAVGQGDASTKQKPLEPSRSEIWISKRDGTKMKRIGWQELGRDTDPVENLHWVPDGKRMSFIYKDALYIAPIP